MRNIKLVLAYDGHDFSGWQIQPDRPTVQGTLATCIGRLTGENVLPQGSGRTDAGVHALGQVATFETQSSIPVQNMVVALNDLLPPAIRVLQATDEQPVVRIGGRACAPIWSAPQSERPHRRRGVFAATR